MGFPIHRLRRLRRNPTLRRMIRETHLKVDDLVMPLFVRADIGGPKPISAMPGHFQWSLDTIVDEAKSIADAGIPAIMLFGIPAHKDEKGREAYNEDAVVCHAVTAIKEACLALCVITDVCLCEYTEHGHCGILRNNRDGLPDVDNDASLEQLCKAAVAYANAGADMVAPSDMMDGRVGVIRDALDSEGHEEVAIMAYSAKYASAFYGPFREAAGSAPQFGDRRSYQMDPGNTREAMLEIELDIEEGADIVMVKPALPCLDVIQRASGRFEVPLAAYAVSGEYSMVKAAAANGWMDERQAALEMLTGIRRAGADIIVTYWAKEAAAWLAEREG